MQMLVLLLKEIAPLLEAMRAQTQAINQLANSNALLAQAIMEQQPDADESNTYLDGTPRRPG